MGWEIYIPEDDDSQDVFALFREAVERQTIAAGGYSNDQDLLAMVERRLSTSFASIRLELAERDANSRLVHGGTVNMTRYGAVLTFKLFRTRSGDEAHLVGIRRAP